MQFTSDIEYTVRQIVPRGQFYIFLLGQAGRMDVIFRRKIG